MPDKTFWNTCTLIFLIGLIAIWGWGPSYAPAQQVNVFLLEGSPARGEFRNSTPTSLIIRTRDGDVEISVTNIRNIAIDDEPTEFGRARRNFENERFDEGLAELAKLTKPPAERFLAEELAYLKAYGSAMSSMRGGRVAAQEAGAIAFEFTRSYPNSYHYFSVVEIVGKLFLEVGKVDLAKEEFSRLAQSGLPDLELRGGFLLGKTQLQLGDGTAAEQTFQKLINSADSSAEANRLKVLAQPMYAKALALGQKTAAAREIVEKLIRQGNPDNAELFALCYNVLGLCHLADGELKAAALDFLHTDLLFNADPEAHAESLYYLATIWPQLQKNDLAFEARENLNRLYRNSTWAQKLNQ